MKQLSRTDIKVISTKTGNEFDADRFLLSIQGEKLNSYIKGATIECGFSHEDFYLLFVSDDISHEDMLRIYLVNIHMEVIDYITLGSAYSTGNLENLKVLNNRTISFRFIGDTDWKVTVLDKKSLVVPFISTPKGVGRRKKLFSYFKVSGDPKPEA